MITLRKGVKGYQIYVYFFNQEGVKNVKWFEMNSLKD